jgi:Mrp family chromosome partitioning ATPase
VSRVEEALRRASGSGLAADAAVRRDDEPALGAETPGLDQYPAETRAGATRPLPVPRDARRAAAESARLLPHVREQSRRAETSPARPVPQRAPIDSRATGPDPAGQRVTIDIETVQARSAFGMAPALRTEHYRPLSAALRNIQDRSVWTGAPGAAERGLRTLFVTSAVPGEGKSLTVANLAVALAEPGDRTVLVIDAGFPAPSLHDVFGLPNGAGLSEFLASAEGRLTMREASPSVSVLTAGQAPPPKPGEGTSRRFRALLGECASRFDWVLVDFPAVSQLPGANPLSDPLRAVLFVIRGGSTPFPVVDRALADIGRGCVVGTVLNAMEAGQLP